MRRTASGHLYADKAEISKCDMMAGNGVVLQVDSKLRMEMPIMEKMEKCNQQIFSAGLSSPVRKTETLHWRHSTFCHL